MNCNTKMKKKFMYQNEHSDRMVLFTDFNINPILLFSKKFTHAQLKNKLKACPSFRAFHRPKIL